MSGDPRPSLGLSAKKRPSGLFDDEEASPPPDEFAPPGKSLRDYLRETPAEALSKSVKLLIWSAAVVVGIVLIFTIYRAANPRPRHASGPASAVPGGN